MKTDECEGKTAVKCAIVAAEGNSGIKLDHFLRHPQSTLYGQPCSLRLLVILWEGKAPVVEMSPPISNLMIVLHTSNA